MVDIQGWNPTLLASMAAPSGIDFLQRLSNLDNARVDRNRVLAELAYMPVRQANEALKNQAYLLQQGYTMGPDGQPVMTPAKEAEYKTLLSRLNEMGAGGNAPIEDISSGSSGGLSVVPVNEPSLPKMNPWMQHALGITPRAAEQEGVPVIDFGQTIDQADMPMKQSSEVKLPYSKKDIELASLYPKIYGKPSDMLAANKLAQDQYEAMPETKGRQVMSSEVSKTAVKDLTSRREKADDAVLSLQSNVEARNLLDSGIISGTGADYLLNLGKALKQAGYSYDDDALANTETFIAARASEVGRQIKQFGSGTGLSDADREYAQQMAAGKIKLDEKSIRKILDISDRANKNIIKLYNKKAKVYSDVPEMAKQFDLIDINNITPAKKEETAPVNSGNNVIDWKDL